MADGKLSTVDRALGGVVVALAMVLITTVSCFSVNLRIGGTPAPVAQLVALVANLLAGRVMFGLTQRRAVTMIPAVIWALIALPLAVSGPGGDVVITGRWQGISYLLAGAFGAVVGLIAATPRVSRTAPSAGGRTVPSAGRGPRRR